MAGRIKTCRFKIHVERGAVEYFQVSIYPTRKRMVVAIRLNEGHPQNKYRNACGAFFGYRSMRNDGSPGEFLGHIYLCKRYLGVSTLTHECVHAALHWGRVKKVKLSGKSEERFAGVVGELVRQIGNRCCSLRVGGWA